MLEIPNETGYILNFRGSEEFLPDSRYRTINFDANVLRVFDLEWACTLTFNLNAYQITRVEAIS